MLTENTQQVTNSACGQGLIQNHLLPLALTDFEWNLNTQKKREDLEDLEEQTSTQETPVQFILIKLCQATIYIAASAFDHRDGHTLFSTSLYSLTLLSLAAQHKQH